MNAQEKDFEKCNRIMVYGTLRKGMSNHDYLEFSKFIGKFEIPNFMMWTESDSRIPFISSSDDDSSSIVVEAFEIESFDTFQDLDSLEGHPYFYERILITHEDKTYWIYVIPEKKKRFFYSPLDSNIITNGDYIDWIKNKRHNEKRKTFR